jgi:sarcosine oxidase subunit beta
VVNAAGPYAGVVGRMVGVALPIQPYRRQVFVTDPFDGLPKAFPMVIDFAPSFYFRREGAGILFGMTDKEEPPSFNTNMNWGFLDKVGEQAMHRVPVLAEAGIMDAWAGLYDTTPDDNPILGPIPGVEGFLCAAGFSGHGFMHSPMTGQLMAEFIVNGRPSLDITELSIERFAQEGVAAEWNVI